MGAGVLQEVLVDQGTVVELVGGDAGRWEIGELVQSAAAVEEVPDVDQ